MRAISLFRRDAGTSTRWCLAATALRMLVRKSEMGSVCIILLIFSCRALPAGFHDAGDFSLECHAAETDTAHLELANVPASAATAAATVSQTDFELRFLEFLYDFRGACHLVRSSGIAQRKAETQQ